MLVCTSGLLLHGRVEIMLVLLSITLHLCTVLKKCFTIFMSTLAFAVTLVGHSKTIGRYAMVSLCRTLAFNSIWTSGDQFAKWIEFERVA